MSARSSSRFIPSSSWPWDQARDRVYVLRGKPQYSSVIRPISTASKPAAVQAAVCESPRYSRSLSANRHAAPIGEVGTSWARTPAYNGLPATGSEVLAGPRASRSCSMPAGAEPRILLSWATEPAVLACPMVVASVSDHPAVTAGITAAGLNTAKAAATSSPGTCPSEDPRLQKYADPSGIAIPLRSAGLAEKPRVT